MQLDQFLAGLSLLRDYYDDPAGYHLGAEHDIIYVYPTDKPVSEEHLSQLEELGWFQPDVETGEESWTPANYDPEEGWGVFV